MRFGFPLLFIFVSISSCSINAEQERNLSKSITKYLFSVNKELKLSIAASTHPLILRQLKEEGDDKLKTYLSPNKFHLSDAVIGKIKSKKSAIHVEFKVAQFDKFTSERQKSRINLYAISEDDGKNWYFITSEIYKSNFCNKFIRLLK